MMSSKGIADLRREKMREEAKKERAQKAKAANILYRKEHSKIGDVGFVSRKVAPNNEDALSHSLKNGLIDYRELLRTKEHHYLGIDNDVPGTPEVNIVNFEESYKRIQPIEQQMKHPSQHLNGIKEGTNDNENVAKCHSKNKDIKLNKDSLPKAKPPLLKMLEKSQPSPAANDKTPKSDPSKIESILKEMIDTAPPLTDIQTPVKTQDSRFPFPHIPQTKDSVNPATLPGKQNCVVKSEEMLKNDLITTSDDETDDEGHHVTQQPITQRAKEVALSASSSSSSSSECSSNSSDSDSSDSETESKNHHVGRKAMKKPALLQPIISNATHTTNTQNALNEHKNSPQLEADKLPTGKIIKNESSEVQVSPLNSAPKEVKKETLEPTKITENITEKRFNHIPNGLRNNDYIQMNPQFSNEYFDSLHLDPLFDEFAPLFEQNTDLESQTGMHDASGNLDAIADMMNLGSMNPPFENDHSQLIHMVNNDAVIGKSNILNESNHPRDHHNHDHDDDDDSFDPVTVDISALSNWNNDLDNDSYFQKAPIKTNKKKSEKQNNEKTTVKKDQTYNNDRISSNVNRKNSASSHNKLTPCKKNSENDWFMNILPQGKKYDLPYVNPDKLKFVGVKDPTNQSTTTTPCKTTKSLKIQIPLNKIKGKSNPKQKPSDDKITNVKKSKSNHIEVKKVKKKHESQKPSKAVGKDIETIKKLMAETSKVPSDHDEFIDVVGTPSPLKKSIKHENKISGKVIRGTPVSSSIKKDITSILNNDDKDTVRTTSSSSSDQMKIKEESKHENCRKRTRSNDSIEDNVSQLNGNKDLMTNCIRSQSSKQIKIENYEDDTNVQDMDLEDDDEENSQSLLINNTKIQSHSDKLPVKIDLFRLHRMPGTEVSSDKTVENPSKHGEEIENNHKNEEKSSSKPTWKPPPNIKIPKLAKRTNEVASKQIKNCNDAAHDQEQDNSQPNSSSCKQNKEIKEKKTKRPLEGRGVKRKDWDRTSKNANQNPNVCGMCGALQKDTGRDPIRLGTYKTSYVEFLSMGKRNKRIADCLDPSERAPKYIDAVLKYIHYLVGLEITGKINTKKGVEEYMCITSQCIDLVDYVINQYGKKENNNINSFDDRFVFLCLRLQSVLYFKLFGIKKDSASRYAKLLSEYFKVRRSPHRVSIKGSTGTPSPMSPTSSQNGSVASFGSAGSSASSGSYDKMSNGNMVPIPAEMFERMQQYFTYTKYLLHGQRLWDDAESLSVNCQEFIGIVSRRIGALTLQSSMLHLVDYISTGLEIIKDNTNS